MHSNMPVMSLQQKGCTAVELKAMGQAINKTVTIGEHCRLVAHTWQSFDVHDVLPLSCLYGGRTPPIRLHLRCALSKSEPVT